MGVSADGKSVLAAVPAGAVERVVAYPLDGTAERDTFTTTSDMWYLEEGPDRSVYANLVDRPPEIVRLSLNGAPETLAAFPRLDELSQLLLAADGRMVVPEATGRVRLMAVAPGKEPVPLIQTAEETSAPMAVVGPDHIAS